MHFPRCLWKINHVSLTSLEEHPKRVQRASLDGPSKGKKEKNRRVYPPHQSKSVLLGITVLIQTDNTRQIVYS